MTLASQCVEIRRAERILKSIDDMAVSVYSLVMCLGPYWLHFGPATDPYCQLPTHKNWRSLSHSMESKWNHNTETSCSLTATSLWKNMGTWEMIRLYGRLSDHFTARERAALSPLATRNGANGTVLQPLTAKTDHSYELTCQLAFYHHLTSERDGPATRQSTRLLFRRYVRAMYIGAVLRQLRATLS